MQEDGATSEAAAPRGKARCGTAVTGGSEQAASAAHDGSRRSKARSNKATGRGGTKLGQEGHEAEAADTGGTHAGASGELCIAASVAAARSMCRLRHLIGSAPVCYGVPSNVRQGLARA